MALAILEHDGPAPGGHRFRVEIGTNRYWSWAVGDGANPDTVEGFQVLSDRTHASPLHGPLPAHARGRTVLDVPADAFDREHRHVQILSFRERDLTGPAVSAMVATRPSLTDVGLSMSAARPRGVPFRDEAPPFTSAMAIEWAAVAGAVLPALLPIVAPLVAQLVSGAAPGLAGTFRPPGRTAPAIAPSDPAGAATADAIARLIAHARGRQAQALDLPPEAHLSQAHVAPALLAALPALMPLLQQVLTPQTVQSLISTADPNRLIGSVSDAVQGIGRVATEADRAQWEQLRALNPGTATPDLIQLMEGMGLSQSLARSLARGGRRGGAAFRRAAAVELDFADVAPQQLAGRPIACVAAGRDLAFPLSLETPRPLPKAALELVLKDPATLRVLARGRWPVEAGAATGRLAVTPSLTRTQLARLKPGQDVNVTATLTWKGKGGRRVGTSRLLAVAVVGELSFDRLEHGEEIVALNDTALHRDFWHKVWHGTFDRDSRRIAASLRYHYALDGRARANAVMATVADLEAEGRRASGTVKSGMQLSAFTLNALLGRLGRPPLGAAELEALAAPAAAERFSLAARTKVSLRGRPGDAGAIWVYPEMRLQAIVLQHAAAVAPNGHVTAFSERRVAFPIPALAHVVGVVSQ